MQYSNTVSVTGLTNLSPVAISFCSAESSSQEESCAHVVRKRYSSGISLLRICRHKYCPVCIGICNCPVYFRIGRTSSGILRPEAHLNAFLSSFFIVWNFDANSRSYAVFFITKPILPRASLPRDIALFHPSMIALLPVCFDGRWGSRH